MGPLLDAQIALALGVKVVGKDGVYTKAPDKEAGKYLLDQTIGKAKNAVDLNLTGVFSLKKLAEEAEEMMREEEKRTVKTR
jgi:hypothetical protein